MKRHRTVTFFDTQEVIDESTGNRQYQKINLVNIFCEISEPGVNVFWQANAQNIRLTNTIIINPRSYKNQQYLSFDNKDYEVVSVSETSKDSEIRINVKVTTQKFI